MNGREYLTMEAAQNRIRELEAENEALTEESDEGNNYYRRVVSEQCAPDELHCTCVPALRKEIERLQRIEVEYSALVRAMKADPAVKLVLPFHPHVTRKLYWANDTEQWEVYSHNPNSRVAIEWHYKGGSLTDALAALGVK
jgi:hypothetical protein